MRNNKGITYKRKEEEERENNIVDILSFLFTIRNCFTNIFLTKEVRTKELLRIRRHEWSYFDGSRNSTKRTLIKDTVNLVG